MKEEFEAAPNPLLSQAISLGDAHAAALARKTGQMDVGGMIAAFIKGKALSDFIEKAKRSHSVRVAFERRVGKKIEERDERARGVG